MLFILITEFTGSLLNAVPKETASTTLPYSALLRDETGETGREIGRLDKAQKGPGRSLHSSKTSVHEKQRKAEDLFQIKEEERHAPGLDSNDIIRATGETEYGLSTRQ